MKRPAIDQPAFKFNTSLISLGNPNMSSKSTDLINLLKLYNVYTSGSVWPIE